MKPIKLALAAVVLSVGAFIPATTAASPSPTCTTPQVVVASSGSNSTVAWAKFHASCGTGAYGFYSILHDSALNEDWYQCNTNELAVSTDILVVQSKRDLSPGTYDLDMRMETGCDPTGQLLSEAKFPFTVP